MWIVQPLQIREVESNVAGKWVLSATCGEAGTSGDNNFPRPVGFHGHKSPEDAMKCEQALTEAQLYGGVWKPPAESSLEVELVYIKTDPGFIHTHIVHLDGRALVSHNDAIINPYEVTTAEKSEYQDEPVTRVIFKSGYSENYSENLLDQLKEYVG